MPEEPQNTDRHIEPVEQWGEPEPLSTPEASYSAYSEPQAVDQQPEVTSDWGETEPSTQPDVAPTVSTPEPFVAPTPLPVDSPVAPVATPVTKKSKKPLILGIILVAFFALLGGGSVLAYNLWYQNPEKVVTDALINVVTAKTAVYTGTMTVENTTLKVTVDTTLKQAEAAAGMDAKVSITAGGKNYSVNGSALVDASGDLYFKVEKIDSIVAEFKTQYDLTDAAQSALIDKLVAKIDGTWIKVSSADLKDFSATAGTAKTCVNDTVKKFKDDKAAIAEVTDLYKKHPFFTISKKLGEKDGSLGYVIDGDTPALIAFGEGLKTTKIYTALHDCDNSFTIDTSKIDTSTTSNGNGTVELWVNSWSHQITKLSFNGTSDGDTTSGVITPIYNQPVQVATPSTSVTLSQLKTDIEDLLKTSY
jgi:hypothetical protein